MKTNILIAAVALLASGAALADNSSGVTTTLSATAYDSVKVNPVSNALNTVNPAAGAYAGFSGAYTGEASSGVASPIPAASTNPTGTAATGTYNAIGSAASSFGTPAPLVGTTSGVQGYGNISIPVAGSDTNGTVYLNGGNSALSQSSSVGSTYTAHSNSVTNQLATLSGVGVYNAQVSSGTGGMSQAGDLTGYNANTASSGFGFSVVDLAAPTILLNTAR